MPTLRQKKLARNIIEAVKSGEKTTYGELLKDSDYSPASQNNPNLIIETEGVQQALNDYGFTEDNAKKVVAEILLDRKTKGDTRINAAKEVFKVHGSYAPEKKDVTTKNLNVNIEAKPALEALKEEYEQKLREKLEE